MKRSFRFFPKASIGTYLIAMAVAVALPILALRLRRTQADRYAGLRSLARD